MNVVPSRVGFLEYVSGREGDLTGLDDFASRIPRLFYHQVNEGGKCGLSKSVLNYKPNASSTQQDLLICQGHHIESRLDGFDLLTSVEYSPKNPHRERTIELLRSHLLHPPPIYDFKSQKKLTVPSLFASGSLEIRPDELSVSTHLIDGTSNASGNLQPLC